MKTAHSDNVHKLSDNTKVCQTDGRMRGWTDRQNYFWCSITLVKSVTW